MIVGTARAAKEMGGYTTAGVICRLKKLQSDHPDIEIILPRRRFGRWRFNLGGIRMAVNLERHPSQLDLLQRIELLESDIALLKMIDRRMKRE